jgi:ankyrin repeat protein
MARNQSAFFMACKEGDAETMHALLAEGVDIEEQDEVSPIPLLLS